MASLATYSIVQNFSARRSFSLLLLVAAQYRQALLLAFAVALSVECVSAQIPATPVLTPSGGTFTTWQEVSVTCATPDVVLHYTLNGNTPTEFDPVPENGKVRVSQPLTLKVAAIASGASSAVASGTYQVTGALLGSAYNLFMLRTDGTIWATDDNSGGQLGASIRYRTGDGKIVQLPGFSNIVQASVSPLYDPAYLIMGVDRSGIVKVKGLGVATTGVAPDVNGVSSLTLPVTAIAVAAGNHHGLILGSDGHVYAFGQNSDGQLGMPGTNTTSTGPVLVSGLSNISQVQAGYNHSLALTSDGHVYEWGYGITTSPNQVSGLENIVAISAADSQSMALDNSGAVWIWGPMTNPASTPQILPLTGSVRKMVSGTYLVMSDDSISLTYVMDPIWHDSIPPYFNSIHGIVDLAVTGVDAYSVLMPDGRVLSAGFDKWGFLGLGFSSLSSDNPVRVLGVPSAVAIDTFVHRSLALTSTGDVYSWGNNQGWGDSGVSHPLTGGAVAIAAGLDYDLALANDGSVWSWGNNYYGQLGRPTELASDLVPGKIPQFEGVIAMATTTYSCYALKNDGTVWTWGATSALPGDPPAVMGDLSDIIAITRDGEGIAALGNDGTVWQVSGLGCSQYPDVSGLTGLGAGLLGGYSIDSFGNVRELVDSTLLFSGGAVAVSGGLESVIFLNDQGEIYCSGQNYYGETGPNPPDPVTGLMFVDIPHAIQVAAGYYHSLALANDGSIWAWGDNDFSQLGHPMQLNFETPVVSLLHAWESDGTTIVPTIASANATFNGSGQSFVTWTSTGAQSHFVQRSTDGGTTWGTIATVAGTSTRYIDSGLENGTNYQYRVIAANPGGTSGPSSATTTGAGITLTPPTNLHVVVESNGSLTFTWASTAAAASGFQVQLYNNQTGVWTTVATAPASILTASWTPPSGTDGQSGVYRVLASSGNALSLPSTPKKGDDTDDTILDTDHDGLTDAEEVEANTDPDSPDTDGDGYNDKVDGWARHPEFSPARLPKPSYAVIDLGTGTPQFINNKGQVIIRDGDSWSVWSKGELHQIVPPENSLITVVGLSDNGEIAVNASNGSNSHVLLYSSDNPASGVELQKRPNLFSDTLPAMHAIWNWVQESGTTSYLNTLPTQNGNYLVGAVFNNISAKAVNASGLVVGEQFQDARVVDADWTVLDGNAFYDTTSGEGEKSVVSCLKWTSSTPDVVGKISTTFSDSSIGLFPTTTLEPYGISPLYVSNQSVILGTLSKADESGELIFHVGYYDTDFHELDDTESNWAMTGDNTILSVSGGRSILRVDSSRGKVLNSTPSPTPSYVKIQFANVPGLPNKEMQAVGGGTLWQNDQACSFSDLIPAKDGWTDVDAIALNDGGAIIGTATYAPAPPTTPPAPVDPIVAGSHAVMLLPFAFISVPEDTNQAPKTLSNIPAIDKSFVESLIEGNGTSEVSGPSPLAGNDASSDPTKAQVTLPGPLSMTAANTLSLSLTRLSDNTTVSDALTETAINSRIFKDASGTLEVDLLDPIDLGSSIVTAQISNSAWSTSVVQNLVAVSSSSYIYKTKSLTTSITFTGELSGSAADTINIHLVNPSDSTQSRDVSLTETGANTHLFQGSGVTVTFTQYNGLTAEQDSVILTVSDPTYNINNEPTEVWEEGQNSLVFDSTGAAVTLGDGNPLGDVTTGQPYSPPDIPENYKFKIKMAKGLVNAATTTLTLQGFDSSNNPLESVSVEMDQAPNDANQYISAKTIVAVDGGVVSDAVKNAYPDYIFVDPPHFKVLQSEGAGTPRLLSDKTTTYVFIAVRWKLNGASYGDLTDAYKPGSGSSLGSIHPEPSSGALAFEHDTDVELFAIVREYDVKQQKSRYFCGAADKPSTITVTEDRTGSPKTVPLEDVSQAPELISGTVKWYSVGLAGKIPNDPSHDLHPISYTDTEIGEDAGQWSGQFGGVSHRGVAWYKVAVGNAESLGATARQYTTDDCPLSDLVMRIVVKGHYPQDSTGYLGWASTMINVPFFDGARPNQVLNFRATDCAKTALCAWYRMGHTPYQSGYYCDKLVDLAKAGKYLMVMPPTSIYPDIDTTPGHTHWTDMTRPQPGDLVMFDWPTMHGVQFDHTTIFVGPAGGGHFAAGGADETIYASSDPSFSFSVQDKDYSVLYKIVQGMPSNDPQGRPVRIVIVRIQ